MRGILSNTNYDVLLYVRLENNRRSEKKLRKRLPTISKINIIR